MRAVTMESMTMTGRRGIQMAFSAVTVAAFGTICVSSAGPVRQIAGLSLIGALACALWFVHRERFAAIVPAVGLTLVFLVLAGLVLAGVHILSTVPVALTVAVVTLAVVWAGESYAAPQVAERRAWLWPPNPLALTGVLIFAAAAALAVHYSAASATADADGASSVAIWAYPSGGQLHVGVEQTAGQGAASLRIVVTEAGVTVATWNDIHLAAGQTWQAPALTVTGNGPDEVVALHGETVVASLTSR